MSLHGMLQDRFNSLYVDDVRTSQETRLSASKTCYGDSFILQGGIYVFILIKFEKNTEEIVFCVETIS
jgi:hypothetical protein